MASPVGVLLAMSLLASPSRSPSMEVSSTTVSFDVPTANACPATHWRAANPILWALRNGGFQLLNRTDLSSIPTKDLHRLRQPTVCTKLDMYYAGSMFDGGQWKREYFTAGAYYIVSVFYVGKAKSDVRRGHTAVFTSDLQLIGVVPNNLGTPDASAGANAVGRKL